MSSTSSERSPKRRRLSESPSSDAPESNGILRPLPTRHRHSPNNHFANPSSPIDDSYLSVPSPARPTPSPGRPTPSPITVSEADSDEYHRSPTPTRRLNYVPQLVLKGHKRGVAAVKVSPDGKWIASCCMFSPLSNKTNEQLPMLASRSGMRVPEPLCIPSGDISRA